MKKVDREKMLIAFVKYTDKAKNDKKFCKDFLVDLGFIDKNGEIKKEYKTLINYIRSL